MTITITPVPWQRTGDLMGNMVPNPGAEGPTASLEAESAVTVALSTAVGSGWPSHGDRSYQLLATSTGTAAARLRGVDRAAVGGDGARWHASAALRGGTGLTAARPGRLQLVFYDAVPGATLGNTISTVTAAFTIGRGEVLTVTTTAVAPAGTKSVGLKVLRDGGGAAAAGDEIFADDLLLVRQPDPVTPAYFDGGLPDTRTTDYVWGGAPDASVSYAFALTPGVVIAPQLVLGYATTRDAGTITHRLLTNEVRFTARPAGPRSGTLELLFPTRSAAWIAMGHLSRDWVFEYADTDTPETLMTFAVVGQMTLTLDAETLTRWVLTVPYQEGALA